MGLDARPTPLIQPWPATGVASLADAESRENAIEQVVGVDRPDQLAELFEGEAKFQGEQFCWVVEQYDCVRSPQMIKAGVHMMPAAAEARGQRRACEGTSPFAEELL